MCWEHGENMDKLITKTGKTFDSDYIAVIPEPKRAYFRICNSTYAQVALTFSNPSETEQIWHGEHYVSGFTRLVSLSTEDGAIKVALAGD